MAQLSRGTVEDLRDARLIADTFVYAMANDNAGLPLPQAPDGSMGLHSGYMNGEISLLNSQDGGGGQQGDVRLAGFSTTSDDCGPSHFCLVLDGTSGGNVAFAMQFLQRSFQKFNDVRYLDAARSLGRWVVGNLTDNTGTGFGGYYLGYPDEGKPKTVQVGKSVENNADIFASMTLLAGIERSLGNVAEADLWTTRANVAGDFVIAMFDSAIGRFYAGTVPVVQGPAIGIDPTGPQRGNDVVNRFDYLDSNSFTTLALAGTTRYRDAIDWRRPVQYMIDNFAQVISVGSDVFRGFNIVTQPTPGPGRPDPGRNGVGWTFTGQAVLTMKFVDALYGETRFASTAESYLREIQRAQTLAPFSHDGGIVAATVQDGNAIPPVVQCLSTPFQCIPERVGLEATVFAIAADLGFNPLGSTVQNVGPVIANFGGNLAYRENGSPLLIADSASLTDIDSVNFDAGKLTVKFAANGQSTDRLTIRNQGNANGQISVTIAVGGTNTVSYTSLVDGVLSTQQIGTFTGGIGTVPLVITLNASATPGNGAVLLRNITYQNVSNNPSAIPRTVSVQLTDGDGGTSSERTKQISVTPVNDAPVIGNFGGIVVYRGSPLLIGSSSTVTDADSANFNTGKLTVKFSANGQSSDRLTIRNEGKANGQISVTITNVVTNSGIVYYTSIINGVLRTQQIGTFKGGIGLAPLVTSFNTNASPLSVRQVLRNITYQNVLSNPPTGTRTVWAQLTDGDGGTSSAKTKQFVVT